MSARSFAQRLLAWFDLHGRHDLPWQHPRTPYRVWLAEVMLQQTQVATVVPYFERFVADFPDLPALAAAPLDEVLRRWAGLGYYARARNLHRAAQLAVAQHGGELPHDFAALLALPGIGRSTAGAILAQAHGARHAILDGNVRRVLARHAAIPGWPGEPAVQRALWAQAEALLPHARLADYTQGLMDLGATLCSARAPACARCPVHADCAARLADCVAEFPAPRPRRTRPRRGATLVLARRADGALLFERRPPVGIWGGLWCPPLLDENEDVAAALERRYGLRSEDREALPPVRHAFTHFELRIQPMRLNVRDAGSALHESRELRWARIEREARPGGLPAPVEKLLRALESSSLLPCPEPSTA